MPDKKWGSQKKAIKATQIAFEVERKVAKKIHYLAADDGITPSSQIRKLIGLDYTPPKRPRLTVSLSDEDYKILGTRYDLPATERLEIKRRMMQELMDRFG